MLPRFSRPSPATAIAVVALVVAGTGVGIAAIPSSSGQITACYAKTGGALRIVDAGKKCRKSEKRLAFNQKGPAGAAGLRGATGAAGPAGQNGTNGTNGADGANGSPAASMLIGHVNTTVTTPSGGTAFAFPSGPEPLTSTPESGHLLVSANATIVARDLAVRLDDGDNDPGAATFTFTLRDDGADTAVSCQISGTQRSCNSGGATATISPGSALSLEHSASSGTGGFGRPFSFAWRATTP